MYLNANLPDKAGGGGWIFLLLATNEMDIQSGWCVCYVAFVCYARRGPFYSGIISKNNMHQKCSRRVLTERVTTSIRLRYQCTRAAIISGQPIRCTHISLLRAEIPLLMIKFCFSLQLIRRLLRLSGRPSLGHLQIDQSLSTFSPFERERDVSPIHCTITDDSSGNAPSSSVCVSKNNLSERLKDALLKYTYLFGLFDKHGRMRS